MPNSSRATSDQPVNAGCQGYVGHLAQKAKRRLTGRPAPAKPPEGIDLEHPKPPTGRCRHRSAEWDRPVGHRHPTHKEDSVARDKNSATRYRYEPDYAVPPGATLQETIDALGIDQRELAVRTGLSARHINQIIKGHAPITHDTALRMERVTGVPARMWNNLEANYREQLARRAEEERPHHDLA